MKDRHKGDRTGIHKGRLTTTHPMDTYFEDVQESLLQGRKITADAEVFFVPIPPTRSVAVKTNASNEIALLEDARASLAECMIRANSMNSKLQVLHGVVSGQYDELIRSIAPRMKVLVRNEITHMLSIPVVGQAERGDFQVQAAPMASFSVTESLQRKTTMAALRVIASIVDIEFEVVVNNQTAYVRPDRPVRSFGGRAVHRWTISVEGGESCVISKST